MIIVHFFRPIMRCESNNLQVPEINVGTDLAYSFFPCEMDYYIGHHDAHRRSNSWQRIYTQLAVFPACIAFCRRKSDRIALVTMAPTSKAIPKVPLQTRSL